MTGYGKCIIAAVALAGVSGCATYDDGYAYGYRYDYGPSYYTYDYGPYYGPYYGYGPGYYVGPPVVGFDFRFRDRDRRDFRERRHAERGDGGHRRIVQQGALRVPPARPDAGASRAPRVAATPPAQRNGGQRARIGGPARQSQTPIATARSEQRD